MATTDRLLYISSDGLVRQLGFDPAAADLGGAAGVASSTHAATSKTTPVDADEIPMSDSAASWGLKKLTWANIKATLKTYFDTLYLGISATAANASQLLGGTWASPGTIGSTAPSTGTFTTLLATSAIGYGIGAGGTVTQATSKATAVTLNKPCGQITMHNAALAGGAFATFQLTNSVITLADSVSVDIKNPVSGLANYRIQAGDIGTGYCWISLQNVLSAGSLSDAVQIQFTVIKGVAS